jgi:hypothetical protein
MTAAPSADHEPSPLRARIVVVGRGIGLVLALQLAWTAAWAAQTIYSCTDASGRRLTSDRPIQECLDREQRLMNKDGSSRKVMPPRMSPKERAAQDEADRQKALADAAYKDAVRRDRNLLNRYPNEAVHRKAREAALDDVRGAIASSEKRIKDLQAERKPLQADAEFYKGKALPFKLRGALEDNATSQDAQREIIENHRSELGRVNALYDVELGRLKRLWTGAAPGSVPDAPASAAGGMAAGAVPRK